MIRYVADPVNNRHTIVFDDADIPAVNKVLQRALNTWEPFPPPDLLAVADKVAEIKTNKEVAA